MKNSEVLTVLMLEVSKLPYVLDSNKQHAVASAIEERLQPHDNEDVICKKNI